MKWTVRALTGDDAAKAIGLCVRLLVILAAALVHIVCFGLLKVVGANLGFPNLLVLSRLRSVARMSNPIESDIGLC